MSARVDSSIGADVEVASGSLGWLLAAGLLLLGGVWVVVSHGSASAVLTLATVVLGTGLMGVRAHLSAWKRQQKEPARVGKATWIIAGVIVVLLVGLLVRGAWLHLGAG